MFARSSLSRRSKRRGAPQLPPPPLCARAELSRVEPSAEEHRNGDCELSQMGRLASLIGNVFGLGGGGGLTATRTLAAAPLALQFRCPVRLRCRRRCNGTRLSVLRNARAPSDNGRTQARATLARARRPSARSPSRHLTPAAYAHLSSQSVCTSGNTCSLVDTCKLNAVAAAVRPR